MNKTYIFSWGGGVNSTAILAMIKLGMLPELTKDNTHIVFADTGAEMPYTYEHTTNCLSPMARDGWKVKVLRPYNDQLFYTERAKDKTLEQYCIEKFVIPNRMRRWCSGEWKSQPINKWRKHTFGIDVWKEVSVMILGIAAEEKHRAKELGVEWTRYPLIEQNVDRKGCFDLCKQAELPIPRKSGCYFCPYQGKQQWIELYKNLPEHFKKAEYIENNARTRYDGEGYFLIRNIPIRQQLNKWLARIKENCKQGDLFELDRHCLCEL
jgi:hypothetical protein